MAGSLRQPVVRDAQSTLRAYMAEHGLKASRQRDTIVDTFFAAESHLTVEELLRRARRLDGRISQATVYRTMKLLVDCGLAEARNFHDGCTRYEPSDRHGEHHDHLICTRCDRIIEFVNDRIEVLQEEVARSHGFVVTDHKMELYGLCSACQSLS
ncbi:MAG: transcriptional repressor [Myxococcota bacterium]